MLRAHHLSSAISSELVQTRELSNFRCGSGTVIDRLGRSHNFYVFLHVTLVIQYLQTYIKKDFSFIYLEVSKLSSM